MLVFPPDFLQKEKRFEDSRLGIGSDMLTGSASTLACSFSGSDSDCVYRQNIDRDYFCMAGFASLCTWGSNRLLFDQASGKNRKASMIFRKSETL